MKAAREALKRKREEANTPQTQPADNAPPPEPAPAEKPQTDNDADELERIFQYARENQSDSSDFDGDDRKYGGASDSEEEISRPKKKRKKSSNPKKISLRPVAREPSPPPPRMIYSRPKPVSNLPKEKKKSVVAHLGSAAMIAASFALPMILRYLAIRNAEPQWIQVNPPSQQKPQPEPPAFRSNAAYPSLFE